MLAIPHTFLKLVTSKRLLHSAVGSSLNRQYKLDKSKVPTLNEKDLEEQFVRGSGPGGQSVAKSCNCVVLFHKPTGTIIKCHETRSLQQNREIAREKLITELDNKLNGEDSIEAQKRRIDKKRSSAADNKRKKLEALKKQWKEREGL